MDETVVLVGEDKPEVRYLSAHDSGGANVCRIFFMDEHRHDIACYNPLEMKKKGAVTKLRDGESLIGVYGVVGKKEYFTSFGFIVKSYEEDAATE